jgi:hypothetical protein
MIKPSSKPGTPDVEERVLSTNVTNLIQGFKFIESAFESIESA